MNITITENAKSALRARLPKLVGAYSAAFLIYGGEGNHKYPVTQGNKPCTSTTYRKGGVVDVVDGFEVFQFDNQPCITGAYRKYKNTHGDLATSDCPNPNDVYPPFPSGQVSAFMLNLSGQLLSFKDEIGEWLDATLGPNSPWREGVGKDVELFKKGNKRAIIFWDTDVNPTVLGNYCRFLSRINGGHAKAFSNYKKLGLTEHEALIATVCFWGDATKNPSGMSYIMKPTLCLKNIRDGVVKDLSQGKSLKNGGDYNRKDNETIFQSLIPEENVNVIQIMTAKLKKDKNFAHAFREMLEEYGASVPVSESKAA
ncbi:MAG: hypothetical protein AB7V06_25665 [Candidatus Obscuribacterales bacterium]